MGKQRRGERPGGRTNLATIPANAHSAIGNRVPAGAPRVAVVPGYDLRHEAPMLTLRVRL